MNWKIIHIDETDSTNRWLCNNPSLFRDNPSLLDNKGGLLSDNEIGIGVVVVADYQTAGRGCGTNRWESERGKNLLFSVMLHPENVPANRQFQISRAISLAIVDALGEWVGDLSIKWPNDIYWRNGKLAGILIENSLQGPMIRDSIIGVGLNVNQRAFHSDAPNPVSLWQICGQEFDREQILEEILKRLAQNMTPSNLHGLNEKYYSQLYRRKGFNPYTDKEGAFMAEIVDVEDDGHLRLRDEEGEERRYAFKEVSFII